MTREAMTLALEALEERYIGALRDKAMDALRAALDEPEPEPVAWAREYKAIQKFYATRTAERSRLPLMRHIDDGLHILTLNGASDLAKAAFCLHPIVQNDEPVDVSWSSAYQLACEYRDKANAYLCRPNTDWISSAEDVRSVVGEMSDDCRAMLIADKRQNYGDFIAAHYGKHARSKELNRYFRVWIEFLEGYPRPQPDAPEPAYERGFIDGMQEQMKRSVDRAVRAMSAKPMTKQEWMAFLEKAVGEFDWEAAGHKREWVGLPDMEVYDLADEHLYGGKNYGILSFYRAIEAKLKEKNT